MRFENHEPGLVGEKKFLIERGTGWRMAYSAYQGTNEDGECPLCRALSSDKRNFTIVQRSAL